MKTIVSTLVISASIVSSAASLAMTNEGMSMEVKLGNGTVTREAPCSVYAELEKVNEQEVKRPRGEKLEGFGIDDVRSYSRDSLNKLTRL